MMSVTRPEYYSVYVTCPDKTLALQLGHTAVSERLAACANILEGMTSVYAWEGRIVEDQETVLLLKTTADQAPALVRRLADLHTYATPCILTLPVLDGHPPYLQWLRAAVG
ncbi:MAG: divalent-cation tolerance protein CutA [Bacteroidia bacterium]|nr:divalent-cation tolerance protein CutA [Bacteroidia bacterium]